MANDIYTNGISGIIGKSPVLSAQTVKLLLSRSGSGIYTASTTAGYSIYNWINGYVIPYNVYQFNQTTADMGNSYVAGGYGTNPGTVTGFVKNSSGRITMIKPYVRVRWVLGARVASPGVGLGNMAYPNPLGGARELNVSFELEEDQPVTLALYTETGEVIEELQMGILKAGKHENSFDLGKLKAHGDTGLLYYKLTTPKKTDIHRIIFGK